MKSPLFPLQRVTFTANRIPTAVGVSSLPANCTATADRLIHLDLANQLVIVRVKLPPSAERRGVHWAVVLCPISSGMISTMDPGLFPGEAPPDPAEFLDLRGPPQPGVLTEAAVAARALPDSASLPPESPEDIRASRDRAIRAAGLDQIHPEHALILGRVGFDAYGDEPGPKGPWTTYDGKPMPRYEALAGEAGDFTKRRWGVAAVAVLRAAVAANLVGPALPSFPGVGYRDTPTRPLEYVLSPQGSLHSPHKSAIRIDHLSEEERAAVRRCTDGFLWLPLVTERGNVWEVPPLESVGRVTEGERPQDFEHDESDLAEARGVLGVDAPLEPGQLTKVQAERLGQPYKALPLAQLLSQVGLNVDAGRIAGWEEPQVLEARSWAWNELNGDKSTPPQFVVDASGLSRVQEAKPQPELGAKVAEARQAERGARYRRPEPDELVHVAEVPGTNGGPSVPAHTVRFKDVAPELRANVTRDGNGELHLAQIMAAEQPKTEGQQPAAPAEPGPRGRRSGR